MWQKMVGKVIAVLKTTSQRPEKSAEIQAVSPVKKAAALTEFKAIRVTYRPAESRHRVLSEIWSLVKYLCSDASKENIKGCPVYLLPRGGMGLQRVSGFRLL